MTKIVTDFIPQRSFNFHLKVTILKKERLAWQICWSSGLYLRFFFENPYLAMAEWIMSLLFYFFFFGGVKRDYRHKMGQCQKQSPEVFCKKGVLRNFAKFTAKHLCQSLFYNKVVKKIIINYIRKTLHLRCLTGFWINLSEWRRLTWVLSQFCSNYSYWIVKSSINNDKFEGESFLSLIFLKVVNVLTFLMSKRMKQFLSFVFFPFQKHVSFEKIG